jgi:hypothetical protein
MTEFDPVTFEVVKNALYASQWPDCLAHDGRCSLRREKGPS